MRATRVAYRRKLRRNQLHRNNKRKQRASKCKDPCSPENLDRERVSYRRDIAILHVMNEGELNVRVCVHTRTSCDTRSASKEAGEQPVTDTMRVSWDTLIWNYNVTYLPLAPRPARNPQASRTITRDAWIRSTKKPLWRGHALSYRLISFWMQNALKRKWNIVI